MHMELIKGVYNSQDAQDILERIIQTKINFLEAKISKNESEEDAKLKEKRIKELQHNWAEMRKKFIESTPGQLHRLSIDIEAA